MGSGGSARRAAWHVRHRHQTIQLKEPDGPHWAATTAACSQCCRSAPRLAPRLPTGPARWVAACGTGYAAAAAPLKPPATCPSYLTPGALPPAAWLPPAVHGQSSKGGPLAAAAAAATVAAAERAVPRAVQAQQKLILLALKRNEHVRRLRCEQRRPGEVGSAWELADFAFTLIPINTSTVHKWQKECELFS